MNLNYSFAETIQSCCCIKYKVFLSLLKEIKKFTVLRPTLLVEN